MLRSAKKLRSWSRTQVDGPLGSVGPGIVEPASGSMWTVQIRLVVPDGLELLTCIGVRAIPIRIAVVSRAHTSELIVWLLPSRTPNERRRTTCADPFLAARIVTVHGCRGSACWARCSRRSERWLEWRRRQLPTTRSAPMYRLHNHSPRRVEPRDRKAAHHPRLTAVAV